MSARRAAMAVAFKNARRNKKRTFYLVALIGLPVLVAVMISAFIRASYISPEEQATSEYGSANVKIEQWFPSPGVAEWTRGVIDQLDPDASVLAFRHDFKSFGPRLHGRVSDIDLDNPLSEGIFTLTEGRIPEAIGEVVLSEHLASALQLSVGDTATFRLRGRDEAAYQVVGLASHPILWRLDEVVVAPQEMGLINTDRQVGEVFLVQTENDFDFGLELNRLWEQVRYDFYPQNVEWPMPEDLYFLPEDYYAAMTDEQLAETRTIMEAEGEQAASDYVYGLFQNGVSEGLPQIYAESKTDRLTWNQTNLAQSPPVIGTAVAAVILAEVAFIAGAAFATGTRRRLREIGLLGANGADTRQVKTSVVGEGLVAGLGGGILGAGVGLGLLIVGRPVLQRFVDRRIEDFPLSALDLAGPIVVAVIACVIAAWLPAKTASNVPTLTALQGRMPVGAPKRWVIPVGLGLTGFGTLLLAVGLATASGTGGAVALLGTVLMIGGAALLAGPIVAWVSKHAERFPITSRIVLRDSGRQRGRAAAAVAATMVILMAPVAGLAGLEANEASQAIYGLAEDSPQILVEGRFDEEYNLVS
ncbi:MAG: FtsX-like permease family protein, partial [Acidimicrobiia bacterium]